MRKKRRKNPNYDQIINKRFIFFFVVIFLLFSLVIVRMVQIMGIEKKKYMNQLQSLTYSTVQGTSSPRGRIYDRNYRILVDNKSLKMITYQKQKGVSNLEMISLAEKISPHINVNFNRLADQNKREYYCVKEKEKCDSLVTTKEKEKVKQGKLTQKELNQMKLERIKEEELNFSDEEKKIAYIYYLMNKGYTYEEKTIKSDATEQEYAYVSEHNEELPGFSTKMDWERVYPYGDTLKSILGTVSTSTQGIPKEEKEYYLEKGYSLNDRVGLSYIEKQYEEYLHGTKAVYEVENSHEMKLIQEGKRGKDIVLTIDINLQKEVERILEEEIRYTKTEPNTNFYDHSNVVIQDPNTGEILAMAGKRIVNGQIVDNTLSILTSPLTPGSVVKGASMLVGYNTGKVHFGEKILDECIKVAGVNQKCSSVLTLGVIDDIKALAYSSNVYQFKIAIRVNGQEYHRDMKMNFNQSAFDTYRKMYRSFGLGVKTEIDLPVESIGYVSKKDKAAGNLLDYAIGQYETYTTLQLSQYISTIANGGKRLAPHLLKEVHSSSDTDEIGALEEKFETKVLNTIDTKPEYMARIKEGFIAVMNSRGGYGVGYINSSMRPSGKTGTSQSFIDTNNDGMIDTETITNSFIGYFPYDKPKVTLTVTSPDNSYPNPRNEFMSMVTKRITQKVSSVYNQMYGIW